jgi:uncharacterized membrane protein
MTKFSALTVAAALIAANIAVAIIAYIVLPANAYVPYHRGFSLSGPGTGHLGKGWALALVPSIAAMVTAIMAFSPRMLRNREALKRSALPYEMTIISLTAVFLVTEAAIAERMMNPAYDVVRIVFLAVAALLLVVGNYLGKLRHNGVFGLRTPWTLKDPRVWDKTHRLAGRLMVLGGIGLMLACLFIPDNRVLVPVMVVLTAGPLVWAAIDSRRIYRVEHTA